MKKTITAAAALLFTLCLGLSAEAGGLTLSQDQLEFGNLKEGLVAKKVVVLKNSGQTPLKIANVTTSCSCTSTVLGQRELKPGESTNLTISYNTWKFPGKFEKYVTVFSGPEGKERNVITMTGYVDPVPMGVVTVKPRKLEVGRLPLGQTAVRELVIQNTGNAPLSVNRVVSKKFKTLYFDAQEAGKAIQIKPGGSVTVKLILTPVKKGRYLDYVMIHGEARNLTESGYKVVVLGNVP